MINLHQDVLELFAEAQCLGDDSTRKHRDVYSVRLNGEGLVDPANDMTLRILSRRITRVPHDANARIPFVPVEPAGPFASDAPEVTFHGGFVVHGIVPLPHVRFACPRGCGTLIKQNAGVSRKNALGTHSCPNAVGHVAARRSG